MAVEGTRTTSVRRIKNPNDSSVYVDLKVIDKISFYNGRDRGREIEYDFRNDPTSGRQVTTRNVVNDETGDEIEVEIIKHLFTYNGRANGQATDWAFFGNDSWPPVHIETQDDKVYADGGTNEDVWIKVRRIVAAKWYNPRDRGQEMEIRLNWAIHDDYTGLTPLVTEYDDTSINPPWRIDPFQQIIDVSWSPKYLAVFYSGNRIAAIPMSKLATDPTPTYDRPANGSWGSDFIRVSQLRLTSTHSVVFSPLTVEDVPQIEGPPISTVSKSTVYNLSIVKSDSAFKVFCAGTQLAVDNNSPIINGDGASYFASFDAFTVSGVSISTTPISETEFPSCISATGDRYYGPTGYASPESARYYSYTWTGDGGEVASGLSAAASTAWDDYLASLYDPSGDYPLVMGYIHYAKNNTLFHDEATYPNLRPYGPGGVEIAWEDSCSLAVPVHSFSQSGGIDSVGIEFNSMSMTCYIGPNSYPSPGSVNFSYIGFSDSVYHTGLSATTTDGDSEFGTICFPYNINDQKWRHFKNNWTASGITYTTPYGTFTATADTFKGWMHVSNGRHVIQAFVLDDEKRIYLDGSSWEPVGISKADIQMVLMDMPLSRIQELAPPPPP